MIDHIPKVFWEVFAVIMRRKGKTGKMAWSCQPITLLNYLSKILEKMTQRSLSALTL